MVWNEVLVSMERAERLREAIKQAKGGGERRRYEECLRETENRLVRCVIAYKDSLRTLDYVPSTPDAMMIDVLSLYMLAKRLENLLIFRRLGTCEEEWADGCIKALKKEIINLAIVWIDKLEEFGF